jgi:predicted metal-dependent hydrolase
LFDRNVNVIDVTLPNGKKTHVGVKANNRTRRINLRIDVSSSRFTLTCPTETSISHLKKFLQNNVTWLFDQLSKLPKRIEFQDGTILLILGKSYVIRQCLGSSGNVWVQAGKRNQLSEIFVSGKSEHLPRRLTDWLKKTAREEMIIRSKDYAKLLDQRVSRVSVRDTKTRWGSCSSKGNLSFSWRLILAPEHVLNYVCAHEVAHLVEMNHSPEFWAIVDRLIVDWRQSRNWLKHNGNVLHRYG